VNIREDKAMRAQLPPGNHDVIVREHRGDSTRAYLLGTPFAPDQLTVDTREHAVADALAYAKRLHVCAWLTVDDADFLLLGAFSTEEGQLVEN
jgi:hypothetical protein